MSAYYADINARDYGDAWNLGGSNLASNYANFANGFTGTTQDLVTIVSTQGDTVSVRLQADESDGSIQDYAGTYTVRGGKIVAANLLSTGSVRGPGPILDPGGDFYKAGDFCPTNDAGLTTKDADGTTLLCVFESGGYHWTTAAHR